ncbi:hypothetical protein SEA_BOOSTSEASON_1 [Mycobacterium phage BoostSeason]|uniref:Gene 1 ring forming protein domain-containing protein n=1 Tax=Mycobacterium phage Mufasa TaxID=1718600 RepID=A0A0M3UKH6_9CAUD|nr:hypothetical protein SEA_MUFASA_1 [Mycobacterium phage Mufasa]ALF00435.1 hypothetical protein SEA_MUFASA_1 [Mycobacterium phage Mufasa]AYN57174.1 hypothetical protein SEA_BOOSTSEASON_1 [Mycobacterium phage BoostSeason]
MDPELMRARLDAVALAIRAAELGLLADGKTVMDSARDIAAFVEG